MKLTRSRSQSASSGKTSGSSSSDSSSSGSSSSSSSGSGSDSSSSDTEASQASKTSRTSQRTKNKNSPAQSKPIVNNTKQLSGAVKNVDPIPITSSSANNGKRKRSVTAIAAKSKIKVFPVTSVSGVIKAKPPSVTNALAQRAFTKKKASAAASSSESETTVTTLTRPVKRVGSKPPTVSIITTSKKSGSITNLNPVKKISPPSAKPASAKPVSGQSKKPNNTVSSTTKTSSNKKKILKSIFSDNSSEESERVDLDTPKKQNSKQNPKPATTLCSSKKSSGGESSAASASIQKKNSLPASQPATTNRASSSALSGTASSNSSTAGSSSDSSSDVEKKPNVEDGSPKSPTSSRKRPVRRTVKSKTIPTTTMFTQSVVVKSSPQINHWESDYSASDEHETRVMTRVPTKTSVKPRPRTADDEDDLMERERRCPFPSCDSSGHLSGKHPTHSMLATCPKYQGFSPEECKENAEERRIRENERKKVYNITNPHQKRPAKLSHEAKNWVAKMKDLKEKNTKDGLSTEYDLSLWVDALSGAAGKIEEEQSEAIGYRSIAVGKYEMSCWCESPYPEPLCHSRRLFICEFCLKPVQSGTVLRRHCAKCVWRHPPGDEIYRKDRLSVWEVDGKSQKSYCQNLCLLAKCFLDHKTLYLDVDPFLFYIVTVVDSQGCHLVGYFSKEKNSFLNYNVSCILTLPPYQRKGFGRLLIDFSYLLTRVEGKVGSPGKSTNQLYLLLGSARPKKMGLPPPPRGTSIFFVPRLEKPLSDLGLISYRSYWKDAVLRRMCACATKDMVVKDLSIELGVTSGDLISTLQFLGMLKYWKGKHLVLKKQDVLEEYLERVRRRGETKQIDPSCLRWKPFQPPAESSS